MDDKLSIFVHRASECLTDHNPHGDGLICFSILDGLARRGHRIFAFANTAPIQDPHPLLTVHTERYRTPANALVNWEYSWRADRWFSKLASKEKIDIVWRMHPYGFGCPRPPRTQGRPLVVGPLFQDWPADITKPKSSGQPRLGVGLLSLVAPHAERGWKRTLNSASLLISATDGYASALQEELPASNIATIPVIVDVPNASDLVKNRKQGIQHGLSLIFVANLAAHKNPLVFCQIVEALTGAGIAVNGTVIGDGPERKNLDEYVQARGLNAAIQFLGKLPNAEVFRHLAQADLLVSTSVGEPYGRGIAEAMSVGTPCICHRSGGPADFIEHGGDGLLVESLSPECYSQILRSVHDNPGVWESLSLNALRKAENWSSKAVLDRLEEILLRLTGKGE